MTEKSYPPNHVCAEDDPYCQNKDDYHEFISEDDMDTSNDDYDNVENGGVPDWDYGVLSYFSSKISFGIQFSDEGADRTMLKQCRPDDPFCDPMDDHSGYTSENDNDLNNDDYDKAQQ